MESEASVLVFIDACDDVAGYRDAPDLQTDPDHLCRALHTPNMLEYTSEGIRAEVDETQVVQPDQYSRVFPGYYSKLHFDPASAYVYDSEYWLQAGNRVAPLHVDHGRTVVYIPPCTVGTSKVWVFFRTLESAKKFKVRCTWNSFDRTLEIPSSCDIVQRPGDVVYVNALVFHSVVLGFQNGTANENKWGAITSNLVIRREDAPMLHTYATQAAMGVTKGSNTAWKRVLPAFVVTEGRLWGETRYNQELELFISRLSADITFAARRAAANTRHSKKHLRTTRLEAVRAAKKEE